MYKTDTTTPYDAYINLAKAYVLGERIISPEFCNAVIRALIEYQTEFKKYPPKACIKIIYEGTEPSCRIRKLFVDYWVKISHRAWDTNDLIEKTSPDFVEDLVKAFVHSRPTSDVYTPCPQKPYKYFVLDVGNGSTGAKK